MFGRLKRMSSFLSVSVLLACGKLSGGVVTTCAGTNLVWSDEFNGSAVDTTKWTFDTGNGGSNPGWGNRELEYYTSRTTNAYLADGMLHIRAQREVTNDASGTYYYTSARMKTEGRFWTKYGRIEWRAKLPDGTGLWPALWMLGTNFASIGWPGCGAIDVAECYGPEASVAHAAVHSGSSASHAYRFGAGDSVTNFHVYGLWWTTNSLAWSVDGKVYGTETNWSSSTGRPFPFPFDQPFFFLMNLAVGGTNVGNPGTNSIHPHLPAEMLVDYIRVYDDAAAR